MTGPEHYREAERLLAGAQNVMDVAPIDGLTRTECAELAQVHATLALAAAQLHGVEFAERLGDISMHSMLLALDPEEADALEQRIRQTLGIADGAK